MKTSSDLEMFFIAKKIYFQISISVYSYNIIETMKNLLCARAKQANNSQLDPQPARQHLR